MNSFDSRLKSSTSNSLAPRIYVVGSLRENPKSVLNFLLNYQFRSVENENFSTSETTLKFVIREGKKIIKGCVIEFFDLESNTNLLLKVENIVQKDYNLLLDCKTLQNVKANESLDCYEFTRESQEMCRVDLKNISLSRLSYVYYSLKGKFVNLCIE